MKKITDKAELVVDMGAMACETIEYQLRCQGYTLGEDAESVEQTNNSLSYMYFAGMITEKMQQSLRGRLLKYVLKTAYPKRKKK